MRAKSTTSFNNPAKLPPALKPLTQRDQWTVYRDEKRADGSISQPPRQARNLDYLASVTDRSTWSDHATAAKAVKDGKADGLQFVLTKEDPFAFLDLDDGRDPTSGSIDRWAQDRLDQFNGAYKEVSPSNDGVHVIGEASNGADKENRAFHLMIDGKKVAVEAYYHSKAMTVTGHQIGKAKKLVNVDKPLQQTIAWGERAKAKANTQKKAGKGKSGKFSVADIDKIVSEGPIDGGNRSEQFHSVVGHYVGIGWDREQVCEVFEKHPGGVAERYISKNLLDKEVNRSFRKFEKQAEARPKGRKAKSRTSASVKVRKAPPEPSTEPETADPGLPQLPQFFAQGEKGLRAHKEWLIKGLIPKRGLGLLSGQWGTYKTFAALDLAVAVCAGEEFLDYKIKQPCGVMWFAYEGADDVALRVNAIIANKYESIERIPFYWYPDDALPKLTDDDAVEQLTAMAKDVDAAMQLKFERPLGLIIIDTLMTAAGYLGGGENDAVAVQDVMNILKKLNQALDLFVLVIDHMGKNPEAGTRGSSAKESAVDVVLACLGKLPDGSMPRPIFNVRKCRGGRQGQRYPFTYRSIVAPEPDEDGDPITTLVLEFGSLETPGVGGVQMPVDRWEKARQQSTRTYSLRLKRELTAALTEQGIKRLINDTQVNTIALDVVRDRFYAASPVTGTPDQKRKERHQQLKSALNYAQKEELIGIGEFEEATHLWLIDGREDDEAEVEGGEETENEPVANGQD